MAIQDLQRERMQTALSMSIPALTAIANGAQSKYGVDSLTAVMALQIKGPAEKAARAQQAGQQPKPSTVKDQVVAAAQPAPTDTGIGSLNAGNVMTEQGMAAGGIVAFDEGGEVPRYNGEFDSFIQAEPKGPEYGFAFSSPATFFDMLNPFESEQVKAIRYKKAGIKYTPPPGYNQQGVPIAADTKAVEEKKQQAATMERNNFLIDRNSLTKENVPFAAPAAADKTQQPPGAPAGFPSVGGALKTLRDATTAYGNFDPMQFMRNVDLSKYKDFLPMTPDEVRTEMGKSRTALDEMFPEKTREEVEQRIAKRYAGLEGMYKQREARGAEAVKEAEKEKGQTAGLGLMQFAAELVTKPLDKINPGAAFQTFKDANSQFRQARKEYREGLDKIAEARELQKIGQSEKADALFREGALARFNFESGLDKLAIAQDGIYKSGALSIADKATQAQDRKLTANLKMGEAELTAATKGAELASEERRATTYADARMGGAGNRFTYEEAITKARTEMPFNNFQTEWVSSGKAKQTGRAMPTKQDYDAYLDARARSMLSANQAYYSGTTAAPSGGGDALDPNQFTVREKK
jgi:hypothetical protein